MAKNIIKPDEHPDLKAMGISELTCEMCMFDYFRDKEIDCANCKLYPQNIEMLRKTGNENNPKWKTRTRKKKK